LPSSAVWTSLGPSDAKRETSRPWNFESAFLPPIAHSSFARSHISRHQKLCNTRQIRNSLSNLRQLIKYLTTSVARLRIPALKRSDTDPTINGFSKQAPIRSTKLHFVSCAIAHCEVKSRRNGVRFPSESLCGGIILPRLYLEVVGVQQDAKNNSS
jgi:hypothetical protein